LLTLPSPQPDANQKGIKEIIYLTMRAFSSYTNALITSTVELYSADINVDSVHTFFRTPSRTRSSMAGTAGMRVGFNIDASPLVPFLILLEVSVKVNAEP
jgi:hypothetical protein